MLSHVFLKLGKEDSLPENSIQIGWKMTGGGGRLKFFPLILLGIGNNAKTRFKKCMNSLEAEVKLKTSPVFSVFRRIPESLF